MVIFNLSDNLPDDEVKFLNENIILRNYFYDILINIKNSNELCKKVILCENSYERRIVHILAHSMGLYHSRYGTWDHDKFDLYFYKNCCWKFTGKHCFKIVGCKVANYPICLSTKDKNHQKSINEKMYHYKYSNV